MANWDYLTFDIRYEGKKHKDWVITYTDHPPLVGLQEILKAHGAQGWELVSLLPEQFEVYPGFGRWVGEPTLYRATFKRPVNE